MAQVAEVVTYVQLCLVASVEAVGGGGLLERQGKGPHYKKSPSLPFLQPLLRGDGMIVGRPQGPGLVQHDGGDWCSSWTQISLPGCPVSFPDGAEPLSEHLVRKDLPPSYPAHCGAFTPI